MKQKKLSRYLFVLGIVAFAFTSCSKEDNNETDTQTSDVNELRRAAEVDAVSEQLSDIIIDAYEVEENTNLDRTTSSASSFLPPCVTVTVVAQQGFREVTLDFGTDGCVVNQHLLRGQIVFSYTRDINAQEILISYNLVDFYFDAKQVIGSRTILRELSNDNGNPQYTHQLDLTVIWPNGLQASREGLKIREWVEGFGSGVFSDNVFEVTGNWTTTFVNGNEHSYEVLTPLRREVTCSYFVSGTVDVQRTNFGGTFDYGSGDCDSNATFTFNNGNVIDIVLN
ncbi:hypothetical protein AB9K26_03555 [Psychroserpens sp. XS_ASV72]|uniref:hypothetical protein n=1 Tax=Psychroserpens sp. XS_ASV72 TaxID=3241293 RepID=UPI0035184120